MASAVTPLIGIAVTTHNRPEIYRETMDHLRRYLPSDASLFVVDDGSDVPAPGATVRHRTAQGIAASKNRCLELLMAIGVEHLFLFDDDCYPIAENWWAPYVFSGQNHLSYLHANGDPARTVVYDDGHIWAMDSGTGCMLYYNRWCIEKVGGMRTCFGKWSFEHLEHSQRIHNMGLTQYPFQDVHQSSLFSLDEHEHGNSSVDPLLRRRLYVQNRKLWQKYRHSEGFVEYQQ